MGTVMETYIPEFWERERECKIAFPTFGNGNGNEKLIPKFWEREWEAGIPGNGREREFPLTPEAGPKGCKLEVGAWRAPRLPVDYIWSFWSILDSSGEFRY